jgi:hypothetical protein
MQKFALIRCRTTRLKDQFYVRLESLEKGEEWSQLLRLEKNN